MSPMAARRGCLGTPRLAAASFLSRMRATGGWDHLLTDLMNYQLFLTYQSTIIGKGFIADVSAMGRFTATFETEGVWLFGVNPGAIAADGPNLEDAHQAMRESLHLVLIDFAQEADDFKAFKVRVQKFFEETDAESVTEWEQAVQAVRASQGQPFELPHRDAKTKTFVVIEQKQTEELTPAMNYVPRTA
jgi:hypothetical protein